MLLTATHVHILMTCGSYFRLPWLCSVHNMAYIHCASYALHCIAPVFAASVRNPWQRCLQGQLHEQQHIDALPERLDSLRSRTLLQDKAAVEVEVSTPQALKDAIQSSTPYILITNHLDLTEMPLLATYVCPAGCESPLGNINYTLSIRVRANTLLPFTMAFKTNHSVQSEYLLTL
jgi:hypothetical protein